MIPLIIRTDIKAGKDKKLRNIIKTIEMKIAFSNV